MSMNATQQSDLNGAGIDHSCNSIEPYRGTERSDNLVHTATSKARGTMENAGKDCSEAGDTSSEKSSVEKNAQTTPFPDYSDMQIPSYSKTSLKKMGKDQLIQIILELTRTAKELHKSYQHLSERVRRDRTCTFAKRPDSATVHRNKNNKDQQPADFVDPEDQIGKKNEGEIKRSTEEPEIKKRTWTPKRGQNFTEHRDDAILVCDKDIPADEEWIEKTFGDHKYEEIATTVLEDYHVIPARIFLLRRVVHKYKDLETGKIYQTLTASDGKFLPGSRLTPDLLAYFGEKYYHQMIPVNRTIKQINQEGAPIKKQDIYGWLRKYGVTIIILVAARMHQLLLKRNHVLMDETYFESLYEFIKNNRKYCYFWQMRSSELETDQPQIVTFFFRKSRSAEELAKILNGFEGKVMSDGYSAYPAAQKILAKIEVCCCLWHVYHQFVNAIRGIDGWNKLDEEKRNQFPAYCVSKQLEKVFSEEKKLRKLSREERLNGRNNVILPLLNKAYELIHQYYDDPSFDQGSLLGKALTYAINRKPFIYMAVNDPDMPLYNLASERNFIKISMLRNSSKFFSTNAGAEVAGYYFTVCSTAEENGRDCRMYLRYLFEELPAVLKEHDEDIKKGELSFLDEHMPWGDRVAAYEAEKRSESIQLITDYGLSY